MLENGVAVSALLLVQVSAKGLEVLLKAQKLSFELILLLELITKNYMMLALLLLVVLNELLVLLSRHSKTLSSIISKLFNKLESLNSLSLDLRILRLHSLQIVKELAKL